MNEEVLDFETGITKEKAMHNKVLEVYPEDMVDLKKYIECFTFLLNQGQIKMFEVIDTKDNYLNVRIRAVFS